MTIGDSFGTPASPAIVTLIAEGYIDMSGNSYMRPEYQSYSLMAGTDLAIGGNPAAGSQNFTGIHYAGHQIKFNGDPAINGVVVAANLADTNSPTCGCNPVPLVGGYMEISGNPRNYLQWRPYRRGCGTDPLARAPLLVGTTKKLDFEYVQ